MDIQGIIDQVVQTVTNAPEKINDILADPRAAIEDITGQTLGEGDLTQIVDGVKDRVLSGGIDLSAIDLSQIDLSKLGGITSLLGGGSGSSPLGGIMGGIGSLFGKK